jgi:hypothetical protein
MPQVSLFGGAEVPLVGIRTSQEDLERTPIVGLTGDNLKKQIAAAEIVL